MPEGDVGSPSRWPHSGQNFADSATSLPQDAQRTGNLWPHSSQNLATALFSCWHAEHLIVSPHLASRTDVHQGLRALARQLGVKILPFVVHHNKGGEILHLNTPDGLHAQLWVLDDVHLFDAVLGQTGCRTPDRPQIKAAVLLARLAHL